MKRHRRGRAIKLAEHLLLTGVLVALLSSPLSDDRSNEMWQAAPSSGPTGDGSPREERAAVPAPRNPPPSVDVSSTHVRIDAWGKVVWSRDLVGYDTARWVGDAGDVFTQLPSLAPSGISGMASGESGWSDGPRAPADAATGAGEGRGAGVPSGGSGSSVIAGVAGGRGGSAGSDGSSGASGSSPESSSAGSGGAVLIDRPSSPAAAVPEPTTLVLLGSALAGLSALARKRRRRRPAPGSMP